MWFGPEAAFVMNAISFLVAALLIYGIDIPQNTNRVNEDKRKIDSPDKLKTKVDRQQKTSKMRALWILISGNITLQVIVGYELLVPMLNGLDNVLISVYAVQEFEAGDIGVGAFYAALGIGLSLSFFAGGTGNACLDTLVMRETPSAMQPVIFGLLSAVGNTLLGLSMLLAGWLLEWMEPRALGFAGGAGFSIIAILLAGYALIRSKKSGEFTAPWKVF